MRFCFYSKLQVSMLSVVVVVSVLLERSSSFRNTRPNIFKRARDRTLAKVIPYKTANHYWPLTKIEIIKEKVVKDECGRTNAKVSKGVTTRNYDQLGTVVSINTKSDSLVMKPLKSRCISDPSHCKQGITIEFWLRFHRGECILTSGGYTKRRVGPGFILKYNSTIRRLEFLLSTRARLWSVQFNVKKLTWVHLMFTWNRAEGVVVYENGEFLTKDEKGGEVRYPSFANKYKTLTVGDPDTYLKFRSGGRFEIGHLVIWIRRIRPKEIRYKAFMAVVKTSKRCCDEKSSDPCVADGCFYDETRCSNIGQIYPCICPHVKENRTCRGVNLQRSCHDVSQDCSSLAQQSNYCNFYTKRMRSICAKSCNFCRPTSSQADDVDSNIMIVAIAVGVACILMLLITIAVILARMNNKWQGEFVPGSNLSGSITADPNTQEMITASVDPAPRITDVPFKSPKVKKSTKVNLRTPENTTSKT